ncbi:hypothetical protein NECAME_00980 [Necator americanus]|uniref:Uncharacterized protein n=1 Tax=Necator americanus TaxID=51031 RepID=W2SMU1_NECAM|nr:hypothetical protein NECAME_00980 [Necator americanus]ETN70032.1 hypothetical protein NECAME_00980 [Necator americanus]
MFIHSTLSARSTASKFWRVEVDVTATAGLYIQAARVSEKVRTVPMLIARVERSLAASNHSLVVVSVCDASIVMHVSMNVRALMRRRWWWSAERPSVHLGRTGICGPHRYNKRVVVTESNRVKRGVLAEAEPSAPLAARPSRRWHGANEPRRVSFARAVVSAVSVAPMLSPPPRFSAVFFALQI